MSGRKSQEDEFGILFAFNVFFLIFSLKFGVYQNEKAEFFRRIKAARICYRQICRVL